MKLKVIKKRKIYLSFSLLVFCLSLFGILFSNLNLGIDMTGGTQAEYKYSNINIESAKSEITKASKNIVHEEKEVINSVNAYKVTGEKIVSVVVGFDSNIEEKALSQYKEDFRNEVSEILTSTDDAVSELSYTNIGKSFGDYIKSTAITTLIIAIVGITLYVAWTFSGIVSGISSYSFAAIVIVTLFHDVIIASGMYILASSFFPEFKIDTFFITALLTILGYSINDTIVIFDRVRANLEKGARKKQKLKDIIDFSINETLRRSIYTSLTLLFVLFTILFFGPESISGFVLVMIFGTIVGTYSSISVASPLLFELNKNKKLSIIEKKVYNPDDKIVV